MQGIGAGESGGSCRLAARRRGGSETGGPLRRRRGPSARHARSRLGYGRSRRARGSVVCRAGHEHSRRRRWQMARGLVADGGMSRGTRPLGRRVVGLRPGRGARRPRGRGVVLLGTEQRGASFGWRFATLPRRQGLNAGADDAQAARPLLLPGGLLVQRRAANQLP